ncbi:MAG: V-type ATP synthase subunit A [Actinomycetota bacterium]|nr:V-type ATP synthase subunit A [Actinomycetota bacterium]
MREGRIIKVSGPLVVAEGLEGAKMYDLVKVGHQRLMGEIIELRGDTASIQVYEETVGLGPGDPVYDTGEPLSVELGPGLLQSIYDGVQRPLDIIRSKIGDFVVRGVEEPGLDRTRKWTFVPKVSSGDKVSPGDIIGVVQETPIIEHRIMVPPGIEGTIKGIYSGEFTVEDTVAIVISEDGKEHPIKMLQRWPVRRPRPYKEKLPPDIPLVTGQRVVDAFFPVAKGGTACVPGPFGSGKCVSGDTPVLLADGEIISIEELYGRHSLVEKQVMFFDGGALESVIESESLPEVITFDGISFASQKPNLLYSAISPRTIKVATRSGRISETTEMHEYHVVGNDWKIRRVKAAELKVGDRIVVPRVINVQGQEAKINAFEILSDDPTIYVADQEVLDILVRTLVELDEQKKLLEVASKLDISVDSLRSYIVGRNNPSLRVTKGVFEYAGVDVTSLTLKTITGKTSYKMVKIPQEIDEDFAEFLGLVASDGTIDFDYVGFRNTDEVVLKMFAYLGRKLFGLECMICEEGEDYRISSRVLARFIAKIMGTIPGQAKKITIEVPKQIMNADTEIVCAFLRGFFHGDGSINRNEIYFPTMSNKMVLGISHLLLRLGIIYRIDRRRTEKGNIIYRITVPARDYCTKLLDLIKPISGAKRTEAVYKMVNLPKSSKLGIDSVPVDGSVLGILLKDLRIKTIELERNGIYITAYRKTGRIPTQKFKRLVNTISNKWVVISKEDNLRFKWESTVNNLLNLRNALDHVYLDEIKEIQINDIPKPVFDFTVPKTHNFIGGFGWVVHSNTVIQHQFSRWADAEIILFIGCGERGNEMTEVLIDFPELIDPYTGQPLMKRTVLIANTSNMPVAAREASVYTGITIAEYFRDMGYNVALQADSTSRWAEALREISGRLEEMPGEEGFPAYLGTRLAAFYERAGKVVCLGSKNREGSITVIGSVSPPGGDLSEPVVQNTLRVVKVFWGLVDWLAYQRHFPAIDWLISYSLYLDKIKEHWSEEISPDFRDLHGEAMRILQRESELKEIVRLVGIEALSTHERVVMETAKSIREDFLQQDAYHMDDTFTSLKKQYLMLKLIMTFHHQALQALEDGKPLQDILNTPVREKIARAKYVSEDELETFNELEKKVISELKAPTPVGEMARGGGS